MIPIIIIFLSLLPFSLSLYSNTQTPLLTPGNFITSPTKLPAAAGIPSFPTIQSPATSNLTSCPLDLSSELFGGVSSACSSLDRNRCCPVLSAWLFAAHARSALSLVPSTPPAVSSPLSSDQNDLLPLMPDDSQKCVDSLHDSLEKMNVRLPRPNATCDIVLCFCGIRLHQIGSLSCPKVFNVTVGGESKNVAGGENKGNVTTLATPLAVVKELEKECRNSSYAGCTRCLQSLEKLEGGKPPSEQSTTDRATKMFNRDCQLMGLTWLLAKNKTLYIPTVSAVLRAVLYSTHPSTQPYKCSSDQENMPLAVDSLVIQRTEVSAAVPSSKFAPGFLVYYVHVVVVALLLCFGGRM